MRLALACLLIFGLSTVARADLNLPVQGVVTSGIGWRVDPFGSGRLLFHRGIDIAVPAGTPVRATRKGVVTFAGPHGGYGTTVVVRHDNGESTLYGHNGAVTVSVGGRVDSGDVIAYSGSSGRSTGPHVHYEFVGAKGAPVETAALADDPPTARGGADALRQQREELMEDAMNSILTRIREPLPAVGSGEGG